MQNTVSTLKNNSSVSHKVQQTSYDPDILHLCIYLREMELCPPKTLYTIFFSNSVCSSQ